MVGFNEWTSAFLYGTDILMIALLVLWLIRLIQGGSKIKFSRHDIFLAVFFLISALSISASHSKALSLYQLIKLAEFIAFYFYIKSNLGAIFNKDRLIEILVLSGFFQAVIAILQYTTQGALGLRIFGESPITPGGLGVASFYVGSHVYLRAYGTFPHPNILATFLMLAIFGFYYLYFNNKLRPKLMVYAIVIYGVMLYGLLITYSRTVIVLMVFAMVAFLIVLVWQNRGIKILQNKRLYTLAALSIVAVMLFLRLNFHQVVTRALISSSDEAVSLRIFYDKVAGQTTGHYPWLGVGIGAFVPKLMQTLSHIPTYYYQPVHNIYLLISAETGVLGIASFLVFLLFLIQNYLRTTPADFGISYIKSADLSISSLTARSSPSFLKDLNKLGFLLVCLTLLSIGLFDHLPWTIQQGRIIFWLALALL